MTQSTSRRTRKVRRDLRALVEAFLALAVVAAPATARVPGLEDDDPTAIERPPEVDPYTGGDRALMDAVGIVSFGPFPWAEDQTTVSIEELLGGIPILWAETAHFRIGSTLARYELGDDRDERARIGHELKELREVLPEVPRRTRELDPWLRLHLYARRLEALYADFQRQLGVSDADFAGAGGELGRGPYLGQPEKYTVLLFERRSSWGRYARRYLEGASGNGDTPLRYNFVGRGTLFYGTSRELYYGAYDLDVALHCAVAFGVAQNLVDGLGFYGHETPLWLSAGTGHWFSRRVDERWTTVVGAPTEARLDPQASRWEPKVRALVDNDYFVNSETLFGWGPTEPIDMIGNRFAWSRVDYLMRREGGAGPFYLTYARPFPAASRPVSSEALRARQVEALAACGLDLASFDEAWAKWVLRNYERR